MENYLIVYKFTPKKINIYKTKHKIYRIWDTTGSLPVAQKIFDFFVKKKHYHRWELMACRVRCYEKKYIKQKKHSLLDNHFIRSIKKYEIYGQKIKTIL